MSQVMDATLREERPSNVPAPESPDLRRTANTVDRARCFLGLDNARPGLAQLFDEMRSSLVDR